MYTFLAILVFGAVISAAEDTQGTFCSYGKQRTLCVCKYVTDEQSRLPVLEVDCSGAGLKAFPDKQQISQEVKNLDLSFNKIEELYIIEEEFSSKSLEVLNLAHNNINYISDNGFKNIPNLRILDLSYNEIHGISGWIFNDLKWLTFLDISYNDQTVDLPVDIFAPLQSLTVLNISYTGLKPFLLSFDNLINSTLGLPPTITHLQMDSLGFDSLPNGYFHGLHNLKHVSLADNPLSDSPILPVSVEYFDFSGTELTALVARHFNYPKVKTLHLNRLKKLSTIDKYAFYNLLSLETLSLDDCPKLREFNDAVFGLITKDLNHPLKSLSIARSGLQRINETYATLFEKMESVNLEYNQWKCDCNLMWLRDFSKLLTHPENMRCATPFRLKDRHFMDSNQSLPIKCEETTNSRITSTLLPILVVLVVFLIALIVYLIYMGPFIYGNRFNVSPRSPYQGITTVTIQGD